MLRDYWNIFLRYKKILIFGFLAAFFTNFGQTFFIGLYGEAFRTHFDLSHTQFGSIYSGVTLCSAIMILLVGHVLDKVKVSYYAVVVCVILALGCVLISQSSQLWMFVLGLWVVRFFGQGIMGHMSSTTTARYVEQGRGRGLSLASMGYPAGEILFPLMVTGLLLMMSWQQSWLLYAVAFIFITLPLLMMLSREFGVVDSSSDQTMSNDKNMAEIIRDPIFWLVLIATLYMPFYLTGVFFHQFWLIKNMGLSPALFAMLFVLFGIGRAVSSLTAGHLVDVFGAERMMRVYLAPFIVATLLFATLPHQITLALFILAAAVTAGPLISMRGSFLAERYGVKHMGAMKSVMTSSMVLSTAVSPILFGIAIDQFHHAALLFHFGWLGATICTLSLQFLKDR